MWTVIYMSRDIDDISLIKNTLKDNNIMTMQRVRGEYTEILVPSSEVSPAHNIIIDTEL